MSDRLEVFARTRWAATFASRGPIGECPLHEGGGILSDSPHSYRTCRKACGWNQGQLGKADDENWYVPAVVIFGAAALQSDAVVSPLISA